MHRPALIGEAVGELVADDAAGAAVIDRRIGIRVKNRRLKNASREYDIAQTSIVSIVGLRRHTPITSVNRSSKTTCVKIPVEGRATFDVADEIVCTHNDIGILAVQS